MSAVFTNRLARHRPGDEQSEDNGDAKTLLIVAVSGDDVEEGVDNNEVEGSIRDVFVEAAVSVGPKVEFDDLFDEGRCSCIRYMQ